MNINELWKTDEELEKLYQDAARKKEVALQNNDRIAVSLHTTIIKRTLIKRFEVKKLIEEQIRIDDRSW